MYEQPLSRKEAFAIIYAKDAAGFPIPCSLDWTTLDLKRKKPSKHMRFASAVPCGASHDLIRNRQFAMKPTDGSHSPVAIRIPLLERVNGRLVL
ncbi:MAG TPA: hypothetical protein PLB89_04720 [Flavobacteriales bacterium]|nr:hypothetical protein [Flavobacteriales bacterium]